jgi:peptidoglycan/LPS O-acetylase OafA/YrhL
MGQMTGRFEELDSLRGLAALTVVFSHIYTLFFPSFLAQLLFKFGPLRISIAGDEAVTLFFVLSGFVLSLPFYANRALGYRDFVVRRFCRIYIPYAAAIVLAVACRELFYSGPIDHMSEWFNNVWRSELDAKALLDHALLIGTFGSNLDFVVWSLVHEMRISLVFPFIMWMVLRAGWRQGLALAAASSGASVLYAAVTGAEYAESAWHASLHYAAMFIVGALIARHREELKHRVWGMPRAEKLALAAVGLVLYLYFRPSYVLFHWLVPGFAPFYRVVTDTWFITLGGSVIIVFALSSDLFSRFLKNGFISHLGRISYSLYLTHLIVLLSFIHMFHDHDKIDDWALYLLALTGAIAVSTAMYHAVERPAIRLGRFLTARPGDATHGSST